jgi:putative methionine-R-sulfoxide reductase with GAF domain
VPLESIPGAFRGVIPSALATCAADGTPNVTYMSVVHHVDSDRVALSRQFFNKTRANLDENPRSRLRVVDAETWREYLLDLEYLHTETHGPVFDAMNANVEAVASRSGKTGVFRLRGVDVHRVLRCEHVSGTGLARARTGARNVLAQLDELTRRLALAADYDEVTRTALESLDDLFGFRHAILLVRDADRLLAVADGGYPAPAAGAEVRVGEGVIGVAARTKQVVTVPNVARSRVMQAAIAPDEGGRTTDVPLPGLPRAQSVAAVPLLAEGEAIGVLYLESAETGSFGAHNERVLRIVAAHLAAVLRALDPSPADTPEESTRLRPRVAGGTMTVTYYQADDSVFVGDAYVVKGVPGRILWKLLREHAASGRDTFTNRELRLDERLGLPPGNDNLEARLLVLRKRLAGGGYGIALERSGRGRLTLSVRRPLELAEVPTSGPMRAAHAE